MSITSLIPGKRTRGKHDADTVIQQLRDENRRLLTLVAGSGDAFMLLHQQLDEAETAAVMMQADLFDLTEERDAAVEEVGHLKRKFAPQLADEANATAVTVPPMVRDTRNGADQATGPIDVRPLQEAAAAGLLGPVVQVSTSGASADPGHVRHTSWSVDDTQPLKTVGEVA